jgi:hypothetical protein
MLESFRQKGFGGDDCEFIRIDNTHGNQSDGYQGVNLFLTVARGEYVIICHQDVLLIDDRQAMDAVLKDLGRTDPTWAACGNCGGVSAGRLATRISDPFGENQRAEGLPVRVHSLDENFIVVRRSANLSVSSDLKGFHLYGTDLCIIADVLGRSAYVVDFHVRHLSAGTRDASLEAARHNLVEKYGRAFRSRWVRSSCALVFLSGASRLSRALSSSWPVRLRARFGRPGRRARKGGILERAKS